MTRRKTSIARIVKGYDAVLAGVVSVVVAGRRASVRAWSSDKVTGRRWADLRAAERAVCWFSLWIIHTASSTPKAPTRR